MLFRSAYFAEFGWTAANVAGLPTSDTVWTAAPGARLTPSTPITLTYDNGAGLAFKRTISIDDKAMFTVVDTVANSGTLPLSLAAYGSVQRQGLAHDHVPSAVVHEGAVGVLGERLKTINYKKWMKDGGEEDASTGGWLGITDKYWLAALIPNQTEARSEEHTSELQSPCKSRMPSSA